MNLFLLFILFILIGGYILSFAVERLNIKNINPVLPEEFEKYYDAEKYRKSQDYLKENTKFGLVNEGVFLILLLTFIFAGGFNYIDNFARKFMFNDIVTGLIFAAILMLLSQIIKIPFSAYHTFVIEEKYGFNKTTPKTFILDILKSWLLIAIIGGIVFVVIILFFTKLGNFAWFYFWVAFSFFGLFLTFVAPVVIMPLFNKFVPLEDGELKSAVEKYAAEQNFKMKGLFKIDGSKRSTKSNAYFTGFGRFKRIALF
ncbi:M48 family metallopeptidase, partial [Elusimicrobiota bacterium]